MCRVCPLRPSLPRSINQSRPSTHHARPFHQAVLTLKERTLLRKLRSLPLSTPSSTLSWEGFVTLRCGRPSRRSGRRSTATVCMTKRRCLSMPRVGGRRFDRRTCPLLVLICLGPTPPATRPASIRSHSLSSCRQTAPPSPTPSLTSCARLLVSSC